MYVIVILKTNLLTLIAKEDSYIFSDGKGNGNTWADRDKISLYAGFHYDLGENKKPCYLHRRQGYFLKS